MSDAVCAPGPIKSPSCASRLSRLLARLPVVDDSLPSRDFEREPRSERAVAETVEFVPRVAHGLPLAAAKLRWLPAAASAWPVACWLLMHPAEAAKAAGGAEEEWGGAACSFRLPSSFSTTSCKR